MDNGNPQIWYGNTRLIEAMGDVDLCVLSADDLVYPRRLAAPAGLASSRTRPEDIALFSCQMEPVWGWNTPRETISAGGEMGLVRDSVPGSSWAFRRADWEQWMGPFPRMMPGEDLEICQKVQGVREAHVRSRPGRAPRRRALGVGEQVAHDGGRRSTRQQWGLDGDREHDRWRQYESRSRRSCSSCEADGVRATREGAEAIVEGAKARVPVETGSCSGCDPCRVRG